MIPSRCTSCGGTVGVRPHPRYTGETRCSNCVLERCCADAYDEHRKRIGPVLGPGDKRLDGSTVTNFECGLCGCLTTMIGIPVRRRTANAIRGAAARWDALIERQLMEEEQ